MPASRDPDEDLVALFRYHAFQNPTKSLTEGRPIFDDVEVCEIRKPGSRDIKIFPATAFTRWIDDPLTGEQTKQTYAERFSHQYRQFKARAAQTVTGTPLEFATFLTEGRRAELRAQNVYTVEALASIDGTELKNLGPGGREMKNKAIALIEQAKTTAPNQQMLAELEALKARNQILEEDLATVRSAQASGEFADMSDEQIRDFITANTGKEPRGALPRKTLVRMAMEASPSKAA